MTSEVRAVAFCGDVVTGNLCDAQRTRIVLWGQDMELCTCQMSLSCPHRTRPLVHFSF